VDPTGGRLSDDSQTSGTLRRACKKARPGFSRKAREIKEIESPRRVGRLLAPNLTAGPPVYAEAQRGSLNQDPHAESKRRLQKPRSFRSGAVGFNRSGCDQK
jgi:hypothetical protein